jgi:hypothetical protein
MRAFLACLLLISSVSAAHVELVVDGDSGPLHFAVGEIEAALRHRGDTSSRSPYPASQGIGARGDRIVLTTADRSTARGSELTALPPLHQEGFSLRVSSDATTGARTVWVVGHDTAGTMYGGLEVAERLRIEPRGLVAIGDLDRQPHLRERGVKFNVPLDARSPSYSDPGDSAQQNIGTVWELTFWREFIDRLARHRYNLISLWNLHPFPSLVRVPEYPGVALADVQRSRVAWKEHYALQATGLDAPEILGNVETLDRLSIDEKIAFWREVMRYGRERNVKFYVVTWNLFTNGVAGKYGITADPANATTTDYFRRSVRELILTYPDLAGIGLTTGEYLPGLSAPEKEAWAFETYGRGVLDALAAQPQRKLTFIHRQHEAGAAEIRKRFAPLMEHPGVDFVYSFKYAEAHALSSTRQRFHEKFVADIGDAPTLWTLRNDDNYHFRWGGAAFVREFIGNLPARNTRGFYYGSDQHIWAREFLSAERAPDAPRELEIAKHDFHWLLWGRLGYEPRLDDARLIALLAGKFPGTDSARLFAAWQDASMTFPLTTGFHWGALDFQWYIEGCQSRPEPAQTPSGFHDINRFISLRPHPATDNIAIPDFVAATRSGKPRSGTTPLQVAERLHAHADRAFAALEHLQPTVARDPELRRTLEDIRAMAHLGKYYGHKIRAATELAFFRASLERHHHDTVARELNQAAYQWRCYVVTATTLYRNPLWTNRVGHVDWRQTYSSVLYDLTLTGSAIDVPSMAPSSGGTILEAEDAASTAGELPLRATVAGFSGRGYREFDHTQDPRGVQWKFRAPSAGNYVLEVRYAMRRGETSPAQLSINGTKSELLLWPTGGAKTWAHDRIIVQLDAGENTITLTPNAVVNLDHVNILPWP